MKVIRYLALVSSVLLLASACDLAALDLEEQAGGFGGFSTNSMAVTDSTLAGDIGTVSEIDDMSPDVDAYTGGGVDTVTTIGRGSGGYGMAQVTINGGVDHPALRDGMSYNFAGNRSMDGLSVNVLGCSGRRIYQWDFDDDADEVDIEVEDDVAAGTRTIYYVATWRASASLFGSSTPQTTASGSFTVDLP